MYILQKKLNLNWLIVLSLCITAPALANVIGNGTQNFAPTTGFHDFATVNSSDTLPKKSFHLGVFLNNASNTLPYGEEVDGGEQDSNQLTGADLVLGYGLSDRFHLAVATPFIVAQQMGENDDTHSRFNKKGNTEIRFQGKFKLLGKRDASGLALLFNAGMDRTSENPHRGENLGLTYIPEIAGDLKFGRVILSANLGYKIQDRGEEIEGSLFEPFGNKLLYSTAAGLFVNKKRSTKVFIELFGDRPMDDVSTESDRSVSSLETLIGAKHLVKKDLSVSVGAGTEMLHGVATPDLRIFGGLNYLIQPAPKAKKMIAKKKPKKNKKKKFKRKKRRPAPMPDLYIEPETVAAADLMPEPAPVVMAPSTAPIPVETPDEVIVINDVNFLFDSDHEVFRGGLDTIDKVAARVSKRQDAKTIVIEGHTCHMGTHAYNESLSFRRAKTIRNHLIKNYGFRSDQIIAVGFGESRPAASNMTERGKRLNRRVEFKIYYNETLSQAGY
jgi:outer membrane protein OmpA-like peptidoglycan-associated protein